MIKPLTSLRFFFALVVFLSHIKFLDPSDGYFSALCAELFYEGFLGVSFFFILSGFVLALNYKQKFVENKISYKEFWIARFARIYPLHLFTLIISIPLTFGEYFTSSIHWMGKFASQFFLIQSFIPVRNIYFSFNIPAWSISDEMFFYILFPFVVMAIYKYANIMKFSTVLLLLIPIGIYIAPLYIEHRFFYVNPLFRFSDFLIGIMLYNIYEQRVFEKWFSKKLMASIFEFSSIILFIILFSFHEYIPKGYRYSCYYWAPMSAILIAFSYQSGYLSSILSKRIFVLLGEISFSFYLLHHLIMRYIINYNSKFGFIDNDFVLIGVIFLITIVASYITYLYIEKPSNRYIKTRFIAFTSKPK